MVKFVAGSIALGVVAYILIHWPGFYAGRLTQKIVALTVTITASAMTYFAVAQLLRFRELAELRLVRKAKSIEVDAG
jgi:hypothetical protein